MPGDPLDLLDADEVAAMCDPPVSGATIRSYAYRGTMPKADKRFGQAPAWYRKTIDAWLAARPGRGHRTTAAAAPSSDENS